MLAIQTFKAGASSFGFLHMNTLQTVQRQPGVCDSWLSSSKHYSHYPVWIPSIMTVPDRQRYPTGNDCVGCAPTLASTASKQRYPTGNDCVGCAPTLASTASKQRYPTGNDCVGCAPTLASTASKQQYPTGNDCVGGASMLASTASNHRHPTGNDCVGGASMLASTASNHRHPTGNDGVGGASMLASTASNHRHPTGNDIRQTATLGSLSSRHDMLLGMSQRSHRQQVSIVRNTPKIANQAGEGVRDTSLVAYCLASRCLSVSRLISEPCTPHICILAKKQSDRNRH